MRLLATSSPQSTIVVAEDKRRTCFDSATILNLSHHQLHCIMYKNYLTTKRLLELLPDQDLEIFRQIPDLVEFIFFQKLPIELRLRVWNYARARNILAFLDKFNCLRTRTPTPVTFRINQESRRETLRHYPRLFSLLDYTSTQSEQVPALHQHFFDKNIDTIYFSSGQDLRRLHQLGIEDFENYCDSWSDWSVPGSPETFDNIRYVEFRRRHWDECMDRAWHLEYLEQVTCPRAVWAPDGVREDFVPSCFSLFRDLHELTIFGGGLGLECIHEAENCCVSLEAYYHYVNEVYGGKYIPRITIHMPEHTLHPRSSRKYPGPDGYACKESCRYSENEGSVELVPCKFHPSCYIEETPT